MLYRRFGHLQARILLNKQDELRELESQLNHIDKVYAQRWPARLRSRDICNAECNDHRDVLLLIEEKYKEYGEFGSVLEKYLFNNCYTTQFSF